VLAREILICLGNHIKKNVVIGGSNPPEFQ
jgi:hypothetical protein